MPQKHLLKIQEETIPITIRRNRRSRSFSIAVNRAGQVSASLPYFSKIASLKSFLEQKKNWIMKARQKVLNRPPSLLEQGGRQEYLKHKEKARQLVKTRIQFFSQLYGLTPNRIFIKDQKTRWGSCSAKKNLNFNWRILFLKEEMQNYLIVHEICHLQELNHSPRFWQLVAKAVPDYSQIKKAMRRL